MHTETTNIEKHLMTLISVMIILFIKLSPFSNLFIPFKTTQIFKIFEKLTITF